MAYSTLKMFKASLVEQVMADLAEHGPSTVNTIVERVGDEQCVFFALQELLQSGRIEESDADHHPSLEDEPSTTMVRFSLT